MNILSRFLRRSEGRAVPPSVPGELMIYAIGDIHGRDDLFADLLMRIEADRRKHCDLEVVLILLGDLVDRGPDSDKVVERALALHDRFDRVHHLIGNHEECMLAALDGDAHALRYFIRIGGDATVRSYVRNDQIYDASSFEELVDIFRAAVPQTHVDFLKRGEDLIQYGDYVFVHAGVRDTVPLHRQATPDLRWIRGEFLNSKADYGAIIVHGHSISPEVEERANRIGIDTGAYASGRLTAIGLAGSERWFIDTAAGR